MFSLVEMNIQKRKDKISKSKSLHADLVSR